MNPRYSLHTTDKTSPRSFPWIWFLRLAQFFISLLVLAVTAAAIALLVGPSDGGCSVPGKMGWNLACAVLALISLVYLTLSSGTTRSFRVFPWWIFIQLGLDALMFIFWIAAAGTSHFGCDDLCNSCNAWGFGLTYQNLACFCNDDSYIYGGFKRDTTANPNRGLNGGLQARRTSRHSSSGSAGGLLIAREALDAVMTVLFFVTLCATAWWMFQNRRAGDTTAAPAANTTSPENGNVQQVATEMKHDPAYNGGAPQQQQPGTYTVNGTQGQQYPPQQQQQQYTQQQGYPPQQQQQPFYPPQQQQQGYQQYPEHQPTTGYYGGPEGGQQQQQREVSPQHTGGQDIPNYPTPTPEMQAEHKVTQ